MMFSTDDIDGEGNEARHGHDSDGTAGWADGDDPGAGGNPHGFHGECYACPVGAFFAGANRAQPDAMDHVLNAAYELLEVARSAIDAVEGAVDHQRDAREHARAQRTGGSERADDRIPTAQRSRTEQPSAARFDAPSETTPRPPRVRRIEIVS